MRSIDDLLLAAKAVVGESVDALTGAETLAALAAVEAVQRQLTAVAHGLIFQLIQVGLPIEWGGTSIADVLSHRLSISRPEANSRIAEAQELGPRRALTGERLEPGLPHTADALREGAIGAEHVRVIREFFRRLPGAVDAETRVMAERRLALEASRMGPAQLRVCANLLSALLNPDGEFTERDRARRRGFVVGPQGVDGMSRVSGTVDPECRAYLDAVLSKLAAPGVCNPDDETPAVAGEPCPDTVRRDARSSAQRNHDALKTCLRSVLASGELGSHHGLPVTVVVSTTLQELECTAVGQPEPKPGWAVTGGGTLLPMRDVIRMATHAHHYLAVFDKHTEQPLYLGRSKRIATADQRIVLHAKDRGCTHPGCTVPGMLCQVHHVDDWAAGGLTNIDALAFACGPHHRLLDRGWKTTKRADGRVEWIPPPHLDIGQSRTNDAHHPERILGAQEER